MQKELLIIIPAYNEEENIKSILEQLSEPQIADIADVLVMNDASSDHTNWLVKDRNYALVTHVYNLGYGSALQLGYKYAIRRKYKYIIQMDADGQHDVCNIPLLYESLKTPDENGNYPDIVLGSRFLEKAGDIKVSGFKRMAFMLFQGMIRIFTGRKISDPTTGLQGLGKRAVLYYSKFNHFDDRYPDANMVIQMLLLGFHIVEVPAVMHNRDSGESMHSGLRPLLYMCRMCLSIFAIVFRIKVLKIDVGAVEDD